MTETERNKKIEILKARLEFFGSDSLRPYYLSFLRETREELAHLEVAMKAELIRFQAGSLL